MKAKWMEIRRNLGQPWLLAILCVAVIPVFPEYIAPLLAGGALIAAYRDARAHDRVITVGRIGKLLLVYMLYMAFGVLYSANPFNSLSTVLMWCSAFMIYAAMVTVLHSRHRIETALFSVALVAGIVGLIACAQYLLNAIGNIPVSLCFWQWIDQIVYQWFPMDLTLGASGLRASSTFNNPNILAEYLVMVVPFVIYYAFSVRQSASRLLARLCLLAAVGGIAFTFSRGSYVALAVIALLLCVTNYKKIMVIVLSIGSALVLIPESVVARLVSVGGVDASVAERLSIWGVCLQGFAKQPLFGMGPGVQNTWDMLMAAGVDAPHAHNLVLQLLMEGGLIGLGLMTAIGFFLFRDGVSLFRRERESHKLGIALLAFAAAFIVNGMFDFPLLSPKLMTTFMLVLACADSVARVYLEQPVSALSAAFPFRILRRQGVAEGAVIRKSK